MIGHKPLEGIRVLDLSRVLAGPFCTMHLADLGAEVIKIELPKTGDDARRFPPHIPNSQDSAYFYGINRGKLGVTLDLRKPEGVNVFLELAAKCDVVVENFSPGTMERFGIGYARLAEVNSRLILCSISGFGQSGPMSAAPAYDIVAQALGGTMSLTGPEGGAPLRVGISIGDMVAALYGVIGVISALRLRELTGQGRHLDIAMLDCQVSLLEAALGTYSSTGEVPGPIGSRHPSITPFQEFAAADAYFVVAAGNDQLWRRLCTAIGLEELGTDPRFSENVLRTRNQKELEALLKAHFARQPRDHWLRLISEAGVPCAPVATVAEVAKNPHLLERQMILNAEHAQFDGLLVPGSPIKTVGDSAVPPTKAPALGEHTDSVLRELLGYDELRVGRLREQGII
jgi:CoA:oxalate CoA-transferase